MKNKYLVIFNSADWESISERVKEIADGWWYSISGSESIMLITTIEPMECSEIRDKIKEDSTASITVIGLYTTGAAAACGIYAKEKTWNWIKNFCDSDGEAIKKKAISDENKNRFSLDNAELNSKDNGIGL